MGATPGAMSGATAGLPVSPEGGQFQQLPREADCRKPHRTWPRRCSWYRIWGRTWGLLPFISFRNSRLGPRQPNLLRNMSRRREFPCERERGPAVVAHPLTSATKRCHPIKETVPTRSRAGQVNRLKLGSPLSRCAKSRVFCNFYRSGRPSEAIKSKTAPVLASSEPKRGLFRASTSW